MNESSKKVISRRNFIKTCAATTTIGGTSALLLPGCSGSLTSAHGGTPIIRKEATILLQGDSITDAGRDKSKEGNVNDAAALGRGYAYLIAAHLLADQAGDNLKIYNRGISGNKVYQLADRWDKDCLQLRPDVLSILIGVNDIWHTLNGRYNGTVEKYEKDYRALLARTRRELPDLKLVICEPFVLRCGAVNDKWFPEFDQYRRVARKMAVEFNALFVPFQSMFDKASKLAPAPHWLADGVHPTMAGAWLMAQTWVETVTNARV
ncbi:MAG: SGNH/GDSL hydrolase family protein [Sedimentisphaerales bacterium]|jgi:lysophospholipase L1-like esterase